MNDVNWNSHLIAIVGARGVGKSTIIRQFIKLNYGTYDRTVLYCSLDSVYFATHTLLDLVEMFALNGGQRLFLDEVHKYEGWSKEIKEIYDLYPEIKIVGSSGPYPEGEEFEHLWKGMKELKVDLVDEHFYRPDNWFISQGKRYDNYDRKGPKVFAGEYACHVPGFPCCIT